MPGRGQRITVAKAAPGATQASLNAAGSTGLKAFGGRVYEEWLPELTGPRWYRTVLEMTDQDPVLGSILFAIQMLLRSMDWSMNSYSDQPDDKAVGDFVEECLYDMSHSWEDTLTEILTMLPYGWALLAQSYKIRGGDVDDPTRRSHFSDGLVGWRKWDIRAQDTLLRWEFDDDGGIQGMWQLAPPRFETAFIDIEQALLFRTQATKGNPEGRSILRNSYRPWFFGKNIENVEGIGIERDLSGLPTAFVPAHWLTDTATPSEKASLAVIKNVVTNVRRDEQEGLVFPMEYDENGHPLFDFKLLSTGGSRQFDTNAILQRIDSRKAMVVLADFVLMGHAAVGSYALATSKTNIFSTAIGAWADSIADVINEYAIPRLLRLNGMDTSRRPMLTHGDIQGADLVELADYLAKLAQSGLMLFPDKGLQSHLMEIANLPAPVEDEPVPSLDAAQAEDRSVQEAGDESATFTPKPYQEVAAGGGAGGAQLNAGGTAVLPGSPANAATPPRGVPTARA